MTSISQLWKKGGVNAQACVAWWDSMAAGFAEHKIPSAANSLTLRILQREGMVTPGCKALDVGCGAGRYSLALAELGAQVTGTDSSPRMLEYAEKAAAGNPSVRFIGDDWHTLNLREKDWNKAFDLVLANMTPAIADADTFLKLSQASKNWCLMVKPSRRTNSVYDRLNELVGATRDTKTLDETISWAFSLLWEAGCCPKTDYEPQIWKNKKTLEDAVFQYTKRIETFHPLDDAGRREIRRYLEETAADGYVEETTHTTVVALYWQVQD
jgi:SAM-dependent methyltransferase